jgi:DNA-binding CsgD family transcriptional regulator
MADLQESPHFLEYLALLRQLHGLISEGKGESEDADRLRDRMDEPWLHLTAEDIARIDKLGATGDLLRHADVGIPLTQREREVLCQLASGLTNRQIAEALHISYEAVKEHVQDVLRKVGVSDRSQAAVWAARKQLI